MRNPLTDNTNQVVARPVSLMLVRMTTMMAFLVALLILSTSRVYAEAMPASADKNTADKNTIVRQDTAILKAKIVDFLTVQSAGYPGKVSVSAGAIDPNLRLASCVSSEVFLPAGSRAWGKTSVGVRCNAPTAWTIYVQAVVSVSAQYLVTAVPLAQGHIVTSNDLMFENGELTQLPAGIFTDMGQAVGRSVGISIGAGTVLRQEMLKVSPVVQQGQTVMVTSSGSGFSVSAEGRALTNANEGQIVQVKVASGQVLSGIARNGGLIQVGF